MANEIKDERDEILFVRNMNVKRLHNKIRRMKIEIEKSTTAQGHDKKDADVERFKSYISDIRGYVQYMQTKPEPDASKFTPKKYPVEPFGEVQMTENELCVELVEILEALDYQTIACNSAWQRLTTLNNHDLTRTNDMIDRVELAIKQLEDFKPLDLQESSPVFPNQGHGQQAPK